MKDTINLVRIELERIHGEKGLELFDWMQDKGFFECRGSSKYHCNYEGGLVDHCINLYDEITLRVKQFKERLEITQEDCFIISFLHDLCKVGKYTKEGKVNVDHPQGHSKLSLEIIERFITLTPFQRNAIKFHMGIWGTEEVAYYDKEYTAKDLSEAFKDARVKLIHDCDFAIAHFKDITKENE